GKAGDGAATRIEASHDGYGARYGLLHRRILIMRDDGSELRGEDLLVPAGKKGKRGKIAYAIRFHIGPGVEIGLAEDGRGAGLALPDGTYWQFRLAGEDIGSLSIEESMWVDGQGKAHPIEQLVIEGLTSRGGGNFSWLLKRMG
ncbi:MAG: heparinase II/III-family protein, partial [Alteripontixanthobacter sp.]